MELFILGVGTFAFIILATFFACKSANALTLKIANSPKTIFFVLNSGLFLAVTAATLLFCSFAMSFVTTGFIRSTFLNLGLEISLVLFVANVVLVALAVWSGKALSYTQRQKWTLVSAASVPLLMHMTSYLA